MLRSLSIVLVATVVLSCQAVPPSQHDEERSEANGTARQPARYTVLIHTPGPEWEPGVPFHEQPGIMSHVQYMARQMEEGLIVLGGPFLDDSGGMMVCREPDLDKARAMAEADPAVQSGLLLVEAKAWHVPMYSVQPLSP